MTGTCCSKKHIFATLAVAVWAWLFDFIVHGNLLKDLYEANASMWRPLPEMQAMWPMCIAYHLVMGGLFAMGYLCCKKKSEAAAAIDGNAGCPVKKSLCFGLWVGLLLGVPQLMVYMWMPIPLELPVAWFASELVKWTLAGVLLSKLYR